MEEAPFHLVGFVAAALHLKPGAIAVHEAEVAWPPLADEDDDSEFGRQAFEDFFGMLFALGFGVAGHVHRHATEWRLAFQRVAGDENDGRPGRIDLFDFCRKDQLLAGEHAAQRHDVFDDGSTLIGEQSKPDRGRSEYPYPSGHR